MDGLGEPRPADGRGKDQVQRQEDTRRGSSLARRRAAALGCALILGSIMVAGPALSAAGDIATVAGNGTLGYSGDGGPATSAALREPRGVHPDGSGNLFIADTENNRVRKVNSSGTISLVAGNGTAGYSGDGGAATSAELHAPTDVLVDAAGNVFVADSLNDRVRKVDPAGTITTVAGTGVGGYSGDGGPATSARLSTPAGLALDSDGNLYIADSINDVVRKVDGAGVIQTVAGNGSFGYSGDGGPATSAELHRPYDLAIDTAGSLHIADSLNDAVRKVDTSGTITTVAGTGAYGYSGDGGPATAAKLAAPEGVAVDGSGNLFLSDSDNHRIRKVNSSGTIDTVAGTGTAGFSGDGGPATSAQLYNPGRIALTPSGDLYVGDRNNHRVRRVDALASPPAPTVTGSTPASPANDNNPRVTGTARSDATVSLYTNSTCTSTVAATGTAADFASPGLAVAVADNSTTTFYATATSAAGDVSPCSSSSVTYVEDSAAPAAPTITSAPGTGNDTTPTWDFSGEAGATFECKLARGATVISDFASCTSPKTYDIAGEPDGAYTFSVRAKDAAGNVGATTTDDYTLDSTLPDAPTITSEPASPGQSRTPSWGFTGEDGSSFICKLTRGATVISDFASCTSPKSYDLAGQPDGTYTFHVQARKLEGFPNPEWVESAITTDDYTLDTTAPAVPDITSSPGALGRGRTPAWGFSGESGASFECQLARGSSVVSDFAPCTSAKTYDLGGEPDGAYSFSVRAKDAAGNVGSAATDAYTLDTASEAPRITSAPGALGRDPTPAWSFSAEPGASFECRLARGSMVVSGFAACTSPKPYDLSDEPDGTYAFSVRATDPAGNISAATTESYALDTVAGSPTVTSAPGALGRDATPAWSFSGDADETFECSLAREEATIFDFAPCTSPKRYDLAGEPDGTYTFGVRGVDAAGNVSGVAMDAYVLDSRAAAPRITVFARRGDASPAWSFAGEAGATFACRLERGGKVVARFAPCTSPKRYDLAGEPDGTYTFAVRATDPAGNLSALATDDHPLERAPEPATEAPDPPAGAGDAPP
nr:hypothetical protein [Actinomycetota bacterium]